MEKRGKEGRREERRGEERGGEGRGGERERERERENIGQDGEERETPTGAQERGISGNWVLSGFLWL
jgi:hypothetical protein